MNGVNDVTLIGSVGKNPEVRHLEGGNTVAKFSLATSKTWKNKSGEKVEKTSWHNIVVWGKLAEIVEKYVSKGSPLYVKGSIEYGEYTNDKGEKKYTTDINAENIVLLGKKDSGTSTPVASSAPAGKDNTPLPEGNMTDDADGDLPF